MLPSSFMKKRKTIVILISMLIVILALVVILILKNNEDKNENITIKFQTEEINAEIADTPEKIKNGLMYRESLGENEGMLFIFDREKETSFWMKNTLIPLDIIFLNKDKEIVNIFENAMPCKTEECELYPSVHPAKYVIEVNAGFVEKNRIEVGERVEF